MWMQNSWKKFQPPKRDFAIHLIVRLFLSIQASYGLTASKNAEIRFRWLTLRLRAQDARAFPHAVRLLLEQGRMKFTRPLYKDLAQSSAEGRELAVSVFMEHRGIYHPICSNMVAKDLGLESSL